MSNTTDKTSQQIAGYKVTSGNFNGFTILLAKLAILKTLWKNRISKCKAKVNQTLYTKKSKCNWIVKIYGIFAQ